MFAESPVWLVVTVLSLTVSTFSSPECLCGERRTRSQLNLKIAGGEEAEVNEFPWAALLVIRGSGPSKRCGGSLINERFVLTAAHCLPAASQLNITVLLGEHDTTKRGESRTLKIPAKPYRYSRHWGYRHDKQRGTEYDFAVVELARSVDFAKYPHIRPVCLPGREERDYDGEVGTVVGWGVDEVGFLQTGFNLVTGYPTSGAAKTLQKLDFRMIKQDTCRSIYHQVDQNLKITESNLCAFSPLGDSCRGDSGGGLVVQVEGARYFEIVGVVSYGVGCNSTINESKIPGVYSRVSTAVDWIMAQAGEGGFCQRPSLKQSAASKLSSGWGSWQAWSSCDRPCGIGRKSRDRYCLGRSCSPRGHTMKNQQVVCNVQDCSEDLSINN
eukprot:GFUD01034008.1.p1 GENE.GFUD01034008.1~~GFUD01034008.1.p1  ORF type:complete len:384 (+),score=80.88 GFUD01034008.1:143-1294(+)